MPQCQAIFCTNRSGNCKKSFFQFPDPEKGTEERRLCKKWIENLKNGKLQIETFRAHRGLVVCEDHFSQDSFDGSFSSTVAASLSFAHKRKMLKKGAVPTLVGTKQQQSNAESRKSAESLSIKRRKAQLKEVCKQTGKRNDKPDGYKSNQTSAIPNSDTCDGDDTYSNKDQKIPCPESRPLEVPYIHSDESVPMSVVEDGIDSVGQVLNLDTETDTQNEESCRNPWHEKWGNNDTKLKWPSQTPKMAQFIFTLLGYEPLGHKNRGRVKSKFCVTCIDRATGLTVEEFKELEAQAKSKWNQGSIKDLRSAQDKSLTNSRRQSENAHIQTQLEKLEKLDISDDEKARQAKQLRMLAFVNPGKFMDDFDPERSAREIKKMNRRCYKEKNFSVRKNQLYDENGVLLSNKMDWCDCLDVECPGCHFPCPKCNSEKCGGDCRCNRKWVYEYVESEGTGKTYSWNLEDVKKT